MGGRYPQEFIDALIARVDIVNVIDKRVPLKKSGREYRACCPFHGEKTPSFFVSPQKQFYHCFGCGAHGTAIGFLMQYERMSFGDAVVELAADVGMPLPRANEFSGVASSAPVNTDLYDVMERAARFYKQQLKQNAERDAAVAYLKSRGLTGEIAAEYELGLAPSGWQSIEAALGQSATREQLLAAGLMKQNDAGQAYDTFRNRIMFPIRDKRGRVVGFGGRVMDGSQPKYLNSPETEIFHKGRELYGLFQARKIHRDLARIIVVEGYMDVVGLAQYGIKNAVATLGTAITENHIKELIRHTQEIVFCFDGDRAGRQAAWRALETSIGMLQDGVQCRFLFIPEGEDPDTLVRKLGKSAFDSLVDDAMSLPDFLFDSLSQKADIRKLDGQARLIELVRPYLEKMPNGALRSLMTVRLAALAQMDVTAVARELSKNNVTKLAHKPTPATVSRERAEMPTIVRKAVALLVLKPSLVAVAGPMDRLQDVQVPGAAFLHELLVFLQQSPHLHTTGSILERWRGRREGQYLAKLVAEEWHVPDEGMETEFCDALVRLEAQGYEQQVDNLLQKSRQIGLTDDEKEQLTRLLRVGKNTTATSDGDGTR